MTKAVSFTWTITIANNIQTIIYIPVLERQLPKFRRAGRGGPPARTHKDTFYNAYAGCTKSSV